MLSQTGVVMMGNPMVHTTNGRGFTPEELAVRAVARIVSVADSASPMVQAQAHAFKEQVYVVVLQYLKQAVASEHTTLFNKFVAAGHPELATLLND